MRAGAGEGWRARGHQKSCPSETNSIRHRRGPIIANLCAEPLYYLRRSSAVAVCQFGPPVRLAMHEESDEIPLPLFLFLFFSRCITMRGKP